MKRIQFKKTEQVEPQVKKPDVFDKIKKEYEEHVEPIIEKVEPVVEKIIDVVEDVCEVVEHVAPVVLEVVQLCREQPPEVPSVEKEVLRVNNPVESSPEVVCHDEEINTLELEDKLLAFEECLLKITPVAKKPITHILGAHLVFNANDVRDNSLDVEHKIVESDDANSFSLHVKNNCNADVKVKINYHVLFD